jgi:hypothetical protein
MVKHYATMFVETREDLLADAFRLRHMAMRMYLKPFFSAGMQSRKASGYLQLITAGREATDSGVLEGNSAVRTRCMNQRTEPCAFQQDCGGDKFGNAGNNIYTGRSKSLCAPDHYSTKKTRKNILNSFNHLP